MSRIRKAFRQFFSLWLFKWHFGQRFQWYRRWYGGRWEFHWIDICGSAGWLDMHPDRKWPEWRQPCSRGTPTIEDWPIKEPAALAAARGETRTSD